MRAWLLFQTVENQKNIIMGIIVEEVMEWVRVKFDDEGRIKKYH